MKRPLSVVELQQIGCSGGGMILDLKTRSVLEMQQIVHSSKGTVILKNPSSRSVLELQQIASSGAGRVIFDFVDE